MEQQLEFKKRIGRPRGVIETKPRPPRVLPIIERQALAITATEKVMAAISPQVEGVVAMLTAKAMEGDVAAAALLLKHGAPALPRTVARGIEDISGLPADQRVAAIAQRAAAGVIDIESATALTAMAKVELETRILTPLRAALMGLKAGRAAGDVLAQLAELLDDSVIDMQVEYDPAEGLV